MTWPTCDQVAERMVVAGHPLVKACTRLRWHLGRHRHDRGMPVPCTCARHRNPAGGAEWRNPDCPLHGGLPVLPPTGL